MKICQLVQMLLCRTEIDMITRTCLSSKIN